MHKTTQNTAELHNRITVNTTTLTQILDCGRETAVRIGTEANAKITIGKRVLWNIEAIQQYLNNITISKEANL